MDFKKKFDYEDINNFLPDNETVGRSDYFRNKFNDKLPSHICDILEIKSRSEFNNEIQNKELINMIKEAQRESDKKLLEEYEERNKIITEDDFIISEKKNIDCILLKDAE